MVDIQQAFDNLRSKIVMIISNLETWNTLDNVKNALGLPDVEKGNLGKQKYLTKITNNASNEVIINAAKKMIESYPSIKSNKLSDNDIQDIQDNLWWIENKGVRHIDNVTRIRIVENLKGVKFWGRSTLRDIFNLVIPNTSLYYNMKTDSDGNIYQESYTSRKILSVTELFNLLNLSEWPDQRFCLLIERIVHPEIQTSSDQQHLITLINALLKQNDFELCEEGKQGGLPIYKVRKRSTGVSGTPKYIIFASTGLKPDILITDTVNMDISFADNNNRDSLVYDQPPTNDDLTWGMLLEW